MGTRKVVRFRGENRRDNMLYFCEVVRDGLRLSVARGNTNLDSKQTSYYERYGERAASVEEAEKRFEQLIQSEGKNFKSQQRTEEDRPEVDETLDPGVFDPRLEGEVLAARDPAAVKGASSVYADWLQTKGDVRGELAGLFLGGQEDEARQWLVHNPTKLFGELDVMLDSELYDLVWEHGFLRGASLKRRSIDSNTDLAALTRRFLALPVARLVTELRFGLASYESDNDWSDTLAAVASSPQAAHLRTLRFDDYTYEDCEVSWVAFGDFAPYWASLPALEDLRIRSGEGGNLGELALPDLKKFVRVSGGLGESELRSIMAATWPKLEHLEVWFGRESYGAAGEPAHLAPLLDGRAPKSLVHLGLVNCEFTPDLIEPLAKSPLVRQLRTLDLSKGVLMDADAELLLKHADAFRHLERLDLTENLFAEQADAIHARLANAKVDNQRYDGDDRRYAALGE